MRKTFCLCFLVLSSCSPKSDFVPVEWRQGGGEEALQGLSSLDLSHEKIIKSLDQSIVFQQQEISGVPIENAFVKKLRNKAGENVLIRALVSFNQKKMEQLKVADFLKNRDRLRQDLQSAFPVFRRYKPEVIEVIVVARGTFYEPLWRVVYADSQGVSWEVRLNNHLQVQGVKRVGSQFHDTVASVFPQGPKRSHIQDVTFKNLSAEPALANARLWVGSQAALKVSSTKEPLKFNPTDARFDQVQVFYYLDESLSWFESQLGFKIPFQLQTEVHVGAPEKTNSAFYYQGKIRLGEGDGETYSHISQDPSIVIHESVHALVDSIAHLPFEGEGGSINEGFADFLTAMQLGHPNMGEVAYLKGPFRRSVVNDVKISDKNGGLYHDSGIVSGVLWDLKERLGFQKALRISMLTLNQLVPNSDLNDFFFCLNESLVTEVKNQEELNATKQILFKRGFTAR
ncbi:hypothetical protein [Bdellovibrio sp. BCCA]|uniref:hypothetical protein n=1 Tax=Bdellovibrio sp. BCCA TaxID=3136281 RepID=UPI0030F25497